jgi:hypothetical protein
VPGATANEYSRYVIGIASVGSSLRIATSSSPGTAGAVSAGGSVIGSSASSSVVGVSAGGGTDSAAGAGWLGDVFTITLRGRFERRGFGTAGDVGMVAPPRRGCSEGVLAAGATDGGLALVLAGRGIVMGPAGFDAPAGCFDAPAGCFDVPAGCFDVPAAAFGAPASGGDALTAGRGSDGASDGAAGATTCGLGLLEPFDAWAPDSGASFGALLIV